MNFSNYEKVDKYKVNEWLYKSIKELTPYQKRKISEDEIVRWCPYEFFEKRKKVTNLWWRLSIIFFPFVWIYLIFSLPFKFIFTGTWGYDNKFLETYDKWVTNVGL